MDERPGKGRRGRDGGGIAVGGSGAVIIEPDMASLSVTVRRQDQSLETARSEVATKAQAARDHLVNSGVATVDLQTSQLSVQTIRHRPDRPRPGGPADTGNLTPSTEFVVATTLTAVFRNNIAEAQLAVDGLFDIVGEGLELHGLTFDCADRSSARIEARRLAFDDAKAKAGQLADLAGAVLGPVRSIRENGPGQQPGPQGAARAMMAAEASIPMEGGSLIERVELVIRWGLASPDEAGT